MIKILINLLQKSTSSRKQLSPIAKQWIGKSVIRDLLPKDPGITASATFAGGLMTYLHISILIVIQSLLLTDFTLASKRHIEDEQDGRIVQKTKERLPYNALLLA